MSLTSAPLRRIAIVGNAGAGKSTLARELGRVLGLPVTHLDLLLWRPGWQQASSDDFHAQHEDALAKDAWIIDGFGPFDALERRLQRADTIIFPDYPLPRLYLWAAKRQLTSLVRPRPDFPENCPQWPKTIVLFKVIRHLHHDVRPQLFDLVAQQRDHATVLHFRRPDQTRRFLDEVRSLPSTPAR